METIAWDLETHLIAANNIAPKPVCISIASTDGYSALYSTAEPEFDEAVEMVLTGHSVGHNVSFDLGVLLAHRPQFAPLLWKALDEDRVTDTMIREKLIVLADTGDLEYVEAPDGSRIKRGYHQADLEKFYLGIDRSALKSGSSDIWRLNYASLEGLPAGDYPPEAHSYALDDAVNCRALWRAQEKRAGERSVLEGTGQRLPHALTTEFFQTRAAFALHLQTCWGFAVDTERVNAIMAEMSQRYDSKNFSKLLEHGILRPPEPARPHVRQLERAYELNGGHDTWDVAKLEALGIKFTKAKPASVDTAQLKAVVVETCHRHKLEVPRTSDEADANVSFDAEAQEKLTGLSPILDEFIARKEIEKLVTTELPRLAGHAIVHPKYDVLKETGRTSSYGDKKGKPGPYPALNIQQIDPRVRECFVARPGHVLCSVDYDYLELVSLAQKCYSLFGRSALRDAINEGIDPHAFLGAQLALRFDGRFADGIRQAGISDQKKTYEAFMRLFDLDFDRWDQWRTFAKAPGLGFPGGLGAETFITYARVTRGIDLIKMCGGDKEAAIEMAASIRAVWFQTYPEMRAYFSWIEQECKDLDHCDHEGDAFTYTSPLGMIRRNCSFTAAANGAALQTPAAEGAKLACWLVAKACYDPSEGSSLLGCHPIAFIHDQIIAEIPQDAYMHERGYEMAHRMRVAMQELMPDVSIGAKPVLMLRWHKKAKTVHGHDGRLAIWHPKPETKAS
jgi:DNA polymerase-1